jgi:hypothetical protein
VQPGQADQLGVGEHLDAVEDVAVRVRGRSASDFSTSVSGSA